MIEIIKGYLRGEESMSTEDLRLAVRMLSDAYYNGEGLVSDAEFDVLQEALRDAEPDAAELQEVGAPSKGSAQHAVPMLSLQKCTTRQVFGKWAQDVKDYVVRPKYDGIAISLRYKHGKLVRAATRGNGTVGEDVTDVLRRVVRDTVGLWTVEVRGELVLPLSKVPPTGSQAATHPRNLVAGVLARKGAVGDSGIEPEDLQFYAYDIVEDLAESLKHKKLRDMGFQTGPYLEQRYSDDQECGPNVWFPDRGSWSFPADGVVCREATGAIKEVTGHHPKHSIAWKFPSESSTTTVQDIEWQTTRYGTVTPVVILDTVKVDGSMISRATLHSYGRFLKLGLRNGAKVQIARRGGVIPHVEAVVAEGDGRAFKAPTKCASCSGPLLDREGGLDGEGNVARTLVCTSDKCGAQVTDSIRHWFSSVGADGFGPRASAELAKRAGSVEGVYRLDWKDPRVRNALGAANTLKLQEQMQTAAKYPGPTALLVALGIPGLGNSLARTLAQRWAFEDLFGLTAEDLLAIEGVGDVTAHSVVSGLAARAEMLAGLVADELLVLPPRAKDPQVVQGPLSGEVMCFTGTLEMPRKKAQELARLAGAAISDSIIVGVTCVVMGADVIDGTSAKARKAYEMRQRLGNMKIWSEQEFLQQAVKDGKVG